MGNGSPCCHGVAADRGHYRESPGSRLSPIGSSASGETLGDMPGPLLHPVRPGGMLAIHPTAHPEMRKCPPAPAKSASPRLFSPERESVLRAHAARRRLQKGDVLFTYGSEPDALFCVDSGQLRVSTTAQNGREAVLSMLEPGQWFGEVSLFVDAPRIYDTRAVADSELLVVPATTFHALVDEQPRFLIEFTRLVCRRYRLALGWIDETILQPFPVRLARRLLWADHAHTLSSPDEKDAVLRLSQEDLSHMLGVSRQSVNRQLKTWESQGMLRLDYGRVTLCDRAALSLLANNDDAAGAGGN